MATTTQSSTVVTRTTVVSSGEPTSGTCMCNVGYLRSWQGLLKMIKIACFLAMVICIAMLRRGWYSNAYNDYCIAIAVIGFVCELMWFIIYMTACNYRCHGNKGLAIVLLIYHIAMFVMVFVAVVLLGRYAAGVNVSAYNAFAMVAFAAFGMEIHFNVIWLRQGVELAAGPCC